MQEQITIRKSTEADAAALAELAMLDSCAAPAGPLLLAFAGPALRAALPLDGGAPIADPFHRTLELVDLLRVRARQDEAVGTVASPPPASRARRPCDLTCVEPRPTKGAST